MDYTTLLLGIFIGTTLGCIITYLLLRTSGRKAAEREAEREAQLERRTEMQFERLSEKVLERRSETLQQVSEERISALLKPLGHSIDAFKQRVEHSLTEQTKQNSSLEEKIRNLVQTTTQVGLEANNLASALKGDVKKMGNWGEIILQSILEQSGLKSGEQFDVQPTLHDQDGKLLRPDVIVSLPEGRKIIIDSKVSLVAYDRYSSAADADEQQLAIKNHLSSIKAHIDTLATKKYDSLLNSSLDFTMMFIPIEPAYLLAISNDPELWNYAYSRRVMLISPTNLIACLKIVNDLWRRELQSKNALKIVQRAELMYSKFGGFVETMESLGSKLKATQVSYDKALSQLSQGNGNLISQAEKMRELGLKSERKISDLS